MVSEIGSPVKGLTSGGKSGPPIGPDSGRALAVAAATVAVVETAVAVALVGARVGRRVAVGLSGVGVAEGLDGMLVSVGTAVGKGEGGCVATGAAVLSSVMVGVGSPLQLVRLKSARTRNDATVKMVSFLDVMIVRTPLIPMVHLIIMGREYPVKQMLFA
jgi:hypothetical protein